MYEHFFGLREKPFDLLSNPKFLLLTSKHEEALSNLDYGITTSNGITLLLGEPGTGKTTLLRKAHARLLQRSPGAAPIWAYINNPTLSRDEFFDTIAHAFGLTYEGTSKARFLRQFEALLLEHRKAGVVSVLVIDEAQSLPYELLEELRLLANLDTDTETLLCVVLAGHPVLGERLADPRLGQMKQRVGRRCALPALDLDETATYIAHRISLAGGNPALAFSQEAVVMIHERSHGIPRVINVICDNALLTGFAAEKRPVGRSLILEVCRDFDFSVPGRLPQRPRAVNHGSARPVDTATTAPPRVALSTGSGRARWFAFPQFAERRG